MHGKNNQKNEREEDFYVWSKTFVNLVLLYKLCIQIQIDWIKGGIIVLKKLSGFKYAS